MDVVGVVGEEQHALTPDAHQRRPLAGDHLLEEFPDSAGALVVELHLALEGDHRALPGQCLPLQLHAQHLGVLQNEVTGQLSLIQVAEE